MQPPRGAPSGAQCAIHLGQPATRVCSRCGNFMCSDCSSDGAELWCPTCRELVERSAFPFTRSDFTFNQLFAYAYDTFKRDWLMLCLAVLVFLAIAGFGTGVSSALNQVALAVTGGGFDSSSSRVDFQSLFGTVAMSMAVSMVINMVVQGFVMLGLYRVLIDALDGKKVDLGRLFSQGRKLGRYVVLNLILMALTYVPMAMLFGLIFGGVLLSTGLSVHELSSSAFEQALRLPVVVGVLLAVLALVVFVVWLYPLWLFGVPELVVSEATPMEALQRAWQMGSGLRLTAFGYSLVVGLVMLGGVALCCVGLVPALAIAYLLNLSLFLAARADPAFPARE